MRSISEIVKHFKQNWTEELNSESLKSACQACGMKWIDSLLNPVTTIQLFLLQVLHGNTGCTELPHLSRLAFTAAAYCKARMRIKLQVFELLLQRCVDSMARQNQDLGK